MKVFTSKTQILGEKGEMVAAVFLMKQGFVIVERNVANKYGEIDIVAKKKGVWHFFEVKAGKQGSWFNPADNLTPAKLRKFTISAQHYCFTRNIKNYRIGGIIVLLAENREAIVEIIDLN
jgi:putative endonuclease